MALAPEFVEATANANLKNVGEAPAFYLGLAMGDAVAHQRAVSTIREAALGSIVKKLTELDASEAVSVLKATSGNDLAAQITALAAALSSSQQGVKAAQTTPPPTST